MVPQGSALVPAAPEEPEANPGTGEDAAGSTQPMEEDDEGGGAGGRPQRLLTALLETVSRLKEARLGGARAALEAAVRLLSALTEEAIAEAPQAAATTAFGSLMAPGTDASLLPLLHVGLQDTNGGKTAAVRSPGALRASVLRLLVGQAAGSEEMLRAWGLTQEEAEADDKAEAEQGEAGADDQGPREDGPASLADLLLDNLRAPTLEELQDQEGWKVSLEKGRGGEAEPKGPEAVWERQQRDDMLARRLQAFLTIGPEADDLTEKCGGFYGSMEAPRSVLAAVAALLENRQWPALKGLLSRGLGHHLVASLDELTREAGVGKVMESVFPPLGLLGLGPGPGRPGSPPEPSDPPSPAVPASLLIEQLRLVHEALLLMATLADERHLGWILLDDLVGSPSTLRTCVTMTSRLEDAAETSEWRQFRGGENGEAPLLCRHGLPLASWAVALQRRRWQQQEQKNPKQKKEASTQGGNAANAAGEGGIMHRCWSGPGGCRGCSSAAQVIGLAREVNARVLEAYEQQRNASAAMSQP